MESSNGPMEMEFGQILESAPQTKHLEIAPGDLAHVPTLFERCFNAKRPVIVADPQTFAAAGQRVLEAFGGRSKADLFIFDTPGFYAEHEHVKALQARLEGSPEAVAVAVGAGTINDVTKLASHWARRRYMSVATAASMDGYTAFGASITHNGSKKTFPCDAPLALIADLEVICCAPPKLNAAGYADLLAKTTGGADWILADSLGLEAIHKRAWDLVQTNLKVALGNPQGVPTGDSTALRQLTEGLIMSGFGMQFASSSRPASGAEHQFSHLWDMRHHMHEGTTPLHGFKVGLGTLCMTAFYEYLLAQSLDRLDVEACCAVWPSTSELERRIRELFGESNLTEVALEESRAKYVEPRQLREQLKQAQLVWPVLREKLRNQLMSFEDVKNRLKAAGSPVEPEEIGLTRHTLRDSFLPAYYIRRRFTVLDLAMRAGLFDVAVDYIFSDSGQWPV